MDSSVHTKRDSKTRSFLAYPLFPAHKLHVRWNSRLQKGEAPGYFAVIFSFSFFFYYCKKSFLLCSREIINDFIHIGEVKISFFFCKNNEHQIIILIFFVDKSTNLSKR